MLGGQFRVTLFGSHGRWRQETLGLGDVGYIPQGFGHSIENIGDGMARILIVFNTGHYQTIDLSQWIAGNSTAEPRVSVRVALRLLVPTDRAGRVQPERQHSDCESYVANWIIPVEIAVIPQTQTYAEDFVI